MAKDVGRKLLVKKAAAVIAGLKTKSIKFSNEGIDVSNDDSLGFQEFLATPGNRSLNISFDGVSDDAVFRDIAIAGVGCLMTDITLEFQDGIKVGGDFWFGDFEISGSTKEAITFSGSLSSSGAFAVVV